MALEGVRVSRLGKGSPWSQILTGLCAQGATWGWRNSDHIATAEDPLRTYSGGGGGMRGEHLFY